MRRNSDYAGALQCENKTLKKRIAMYESGEEYQRIINDKDRVIDEYAQMNRKLKKEIEDLHRALGRVWNEAETELEEERGKNQKLRAQINRNYENSSIPSSQCRNRKKKRKQPGENRAKARSADRS